MFAKNLPIGEPNPHAPEASDKLVATWWFWIKAGMGFTFGASIMALFCGFVWTVFILPLWLRLVFRGF